MARSPYLIYWYYLRRSATEYYAVVNDAVATIPAADAQPLDDDPEGWDEDGVRWSRDPEWLGVHPAYTESLQFHTVASQILRHVLRTEGINGRVELEVRKQDTTGGTLLHLPHYIAPIDLRSFTADEFTVNCKLKPGRAYSMLQANKDVPYSFLPLLGPELSLDGVELQASYRYTPVTDSNNNPQPQTIGNGPNQRLLNLAYYQNDSEYNIAEGKVMALQQLIDPSGGAIIATRFEDYIYRTLVDQVAQFEITGNLTITNDPGSAASVKASIYLYAADENRNIVSTQTVFTTPNFLAPGQSTTFTLSGLTSDVSLAKYSRLFVSVGISAVTGTGNNQISFYLQPNTSLLGDNGARVLSKFRIGASTSKVLRYPALWGGLVNFATAGTVAGNSAFLNNATLSRNSNWDSRPYDLVVLSGDGLRRIGDATTQKITTTISDLFKDAKRWGVGIHAKDTEARLEPWAYFFDRSYQIADLGVVGSLEIEPATAYFAKQIVTGFRDDSLDTLNGRDAYNFSHTYLTPLLDETRSDDQTSPYKADPYQIEKQRVNLDGQNSTDSNGDTGVYLIDTTTPASGPLQVYRPAIASPATSGLRSPSTASNLSLTGGRHARRLAPWLASTLYPLNGQTITFQKGDKNTNVVTDIGAGTVAENAAITIPEASEALFLPFTVKSRTVAPDSFTASMLYNPHGYVRFIWNDTLFTAFVMKAGQIDATRKEFDFELLLTPDNDLEALFNG